MNISEAFENANPTNFTNLGGSSSRSINGPYISKQGRLFGVTEKNDDYLIIRFAVLNGHKIVAVNSSTSEDENAIKSSAVSTGKPFLNIQRLCKEWFGDNTENWRKELRHIETKDGVKYYEVVNE